MTDTDEKSLLVLDDLSVQRGEFILCQGLNFNLKPGDICHLIGENGLGKTTLFNQIAGLLPTQTGLIKKSPLVYISHQLGISVDLTVYQNLAFLLSLYDVDYYQDILDKALDDVGLWGLGETPSSQLSAGQTRRIGLARLFVMTPEHAPLWLLDEPLTALDKNMTAQIEDRMQAFAKLGGAILTTSHQTIQGTTMTINLADFAL